MDIGTLFDKLTDIQLSIGVEDSLTVRYKVIDVQDCLLQMQRERLESLSSRCGQNEVRLTAAAFLFSLRSLLGRWRVFIAIRFPGAASLLLRK
jgi:hypothetical protein